MSVTLINSFAFGSSVSGWTFVGSCTSVTNSLDFSSLSAGAVSAGDLLVYIDDTRDAATNSVTAVTPSGFTNLINEASGGPNNRRARLSVKKAAGSEGAIVGMDDDNMQKVGLVFRPSATFTTITAGGSNTEFTASNPSSQTCNPSAETVPVVVIGVASAEASTAAFTTASPAFDATVSTSDSDMIVGYKIYNSSPASHTIDMGDLGENWLASLYLKVS